MCTTATSAATFPTLSRMFLILTSEFCKGIMLALNLRCSGPCILTTTCMVEGTPRLPLTSSWLGGASAKPLTTENAIVCVRSMG
mmetsp:Transcript_2662/g.4751  ORF Transcript_2662/g.4751 Transcript_2662/m.4751 type:complete len:84 (+) Transcript_2662:953-1204(+)